MPLSRRRAEAVNIWPGFVDALTQLAMVMVFVLLIFTVVQFYLSNAVNEGDLTIKKLTAELHDLDDMLGLDKAKIRALSANVASDQAEIATLTVARDRAAGDLATARADLGARDVTLAQLNQNVDALKAQLAALAHALDLAQADAKTKAQTIQDLGAKLNAALARKVEELAAYRSEFFGRLKQILGERADIRIVGDRFVFQSEVLFQPASATLEPAARKRLMPLVSALREIAAKIPPALHWILEIDGHTDPRPVNTPQFHSNWQLSAARAVSVVDFLIAQGIPPDHLAAAGFAQWQPLDPGQDEAAWHKNRRIELKLTQY